MSRTARLLFVLGLWLAPPVPASAAPLIIDGATPALTSCPGGTVLGGGTACSYGGWHEFDYIDIRNGGTLEVVVYDGADKLNSGNVVLKATGLDPTSSFSIHVDVTSTITADGRGYQRVLCDDGPGPNATAGGRGGCSVLDSGGGGAHFGSGGRGTKDCFVYGDPNTCQFPQEWEEDCGYLNGGSCAGVGSCYDNDGLPAVSGVAYTHSIYEVEFGAAGGDKGCRDGWDACSVAGPGGGRIVLVAVPGNGQVLIDGVVSADGWRGCGHGNDSAGGGAGGTILIVGDNVTIGDGADISVGGGLGGDTQGHPDCPACAQSGGTCDDCGGGGGGGIISVLSGTPVQVGSLAQFDVSGAVGGTCPICSGEAGGGAGELQINGVYTGEFCDGYDNDFDGLVDEGLGNQTCGTGACEVTVATCSGGAPNDCVPQPIPSCQDPLTDTRSRFMVIADTSGSMLLDLNGVWTFGDGSTGHVGVDTDGDGTAGNDSRLYQAKQALTDVISAYVPDIDFGLARFAQGTGSDVNCQLAHWFECSGICCTYDNPVNNTVSTPSCTVDAGAAGTLTVYPESPSLDQCINYAGWCGGARRGADVLVGFEKPVGQLLMWLDHDETNFVNDRTEGDHCDYASGGDCELRGTGPTPLAGSIYAAKDYLGRTIAEDAIGGCRSYGLILLTDGTETCMGDPQAAAAELLADLGVETYVIGFSVLASEQTALNAIANAGSTSGTRPAIFAGDADELAAALASIVADSVVFELCNGLDDDCDGLIDEDFTSLGQPCDDGLLGICLGTGHYVCSADQQGVTCQVDTPGQAPSPEICDGLDNNCNGEVDEGNVCCNGPEVCNGVDDYCGNNPPWDDGAQDPRIWSGAVRLSCGSSEGECVPGQMECVAGQPQCVGAQGPWAEQCDTLDHNCNGLNHDVAPDFTCIVQPTTHGSCSGVRICEEPGVWSACMGQPAGPEICNGLDDNCDGQADEGLDYQYSCGLGVCEHLVDFCTGGVEGTCDPLLGASTEAWADPNVNPAVCDTLDQNCNGIVNDGVPNRDCSVTNSFGTCTGTESCDALGQWGGCTAAVPAAELCNNLDDNCNGQTDENLTQACYTGPAGSVGVGICQAGTRTCAAGGWGACLGQMTPEPEVCDGLDNDCDTSVDEDASGLPLTQPCQVSNGFGTCLGVLTCTGNPLDLWTACSAETPLEETCNGQDDNCDGLIDGITRACYSYADGCTEVSPGAWSCLGLCGVGIQTCPSLPNPAPANTWGACQFDIGPVPETCDGLDNDCDGAVDEDLDGSALSQVCYWPGYGAGTGCQAPGSCEGACHEGLRLCGDQSPGEWGACLGAQIPVQETCDGTDNDCDGQIDEVGDLPWIGQPCPASLGVCNGIWDCQAGVKVCVGGQTQPGRCNGLDDDCDGQIDELDELQQDPQYGQSCGTDEGACEAGVLQCIGGAWVCVGAVDPGEETCDGADNDCDGVIDNEADCPPVGALDFYCIEGSCRMECDPTDEHPCTGLTDHECVEREVDGEMVWVCMPVVGDCGGETCPSGWVCVDDQCVNPCDPDPCKSWQTCVGGVCFDESCTSPIYPCPAGQFCLDHTCQDDPCLTAGCDPLSEACRRDCDATGCETSCEPVCGCAPDQLCGPDGECQPDPCDGVECGVGERCDPDSGSCEPDPCPPLQCAQGLYCHDGDCLEDPCLAIACPLSYDCVVVEAGDGTDLDVTCQADPEYWVPGSGAADLLATGEGGCACRTQAPGDAPGLILLLLLTGLALRRSRRRGAPRRMGGGR